MAAKKKRFKGANWSKEVLRSVFKPMPKLPIWMWLEKHCKVPLITGSPTPGPYRIHRAPLMKHWFEMHEDPDVHFLSFAKSARVGGTMFGILCDLYIIANKPGPILWVFPTTQNARDDSQKDYQPFIEACGPTDDLRSKTKEGWTRLFMFFRDCYVKLVGSNSPANLAGVQAEHLRINEVDKLTDIPGREAPPAELAISRTTMFQSTRKIIRNSTPTLPTALAWQYFLRGSQEYAYVPCPRCGHEQRLTFFKEDRVGLEGEKIRDEKGNPKQTGQVVFKHCKGEDGVYDLSKVEEETYYECEECLGKIEHSELQGMMLDEKAGWRKHNPKHNKGELSGHLTTLYSSFFSWGWIAAEWIRNKDTPGGRQYFFNQILGLPFEHTKTTINLETIKNICKTSPKYKRTTLNVNTLPAKPSVIAMQVDVQGESTGMWWTIFMWDAEWNMYLLDWASKEARGFEDLDQLLNRVFVYEDETYEINQVAIDMGHRTSQVYDWCERNPIAFPFQGRDVGRNGGLFRPVVEQEVEGRDLTLVQFIDRFFKGELYQKRIAFRSGRGFYIPEWESKENIEDGVDKELVAQLTNERCDNDGNWVGVTSKRPDWNHLGDCCKMAVVQDYQYDIARRVASAEEEEAESERKRIAGSKLHSHRK